MNDFFSSKKEILAIIGTILFIFCLNIGYEFFKFYSFKQKNIQNLEATILLNYIKINKKDNKYRVLKLQSNNFIFYTTSKNLNLKLEAQDKIALKIITKNINFKNFLAKKFYAPSFDIKILQKEDGLKENLYFFIKNQHKSTIMQEFFNALYLASSVSSDLRNDIMHWGISHLVAISGFHLGIIFATLFFVLKLFYKPFQNRFFPYRNLNIDLSLIVFALIFLYLWLIDFVPSFLRSFVMSLIAFIFVIKRIKIISFANLALSSLLILAIFPNLLFSLGFLFSVMGVFYIFLYLHHFENNFNLYTNVILLNIWTFFAMVIPVLNWFSLISMQQFSVMILSIFFTIFYPLMAILHIFGYGFVFDNFLEQMLSYRLEYTNISLPLWIFFSYIILSLISIRYKYLAIFCVSLGIFPFFFI